MAVAREPRFEKVDTSYNFAQMEQELLSFWEQERVFALSLEKDSPRGNWVFYEGPPTANALPHPGHVLTRVIKDCLPRFKTMQGHYVRRQAGWDTHGLPVELSVEAELHASGEMTERGPQAIIEYGLERFNQKCFESVRRYEQEWVRLSNRIGFWLDYDNAYFTFTNKYVESVWWLLKQIHDRKLMYRGYKIQWYSTLVGTGLSSHEVAQNWQTVKDPSAWVRCRVPKGVHIGGHVSNQNTYFLLWTTTPWTLLSNVALCVHPDYDYVVVEFHNEQLDRREFLVLAQGLLKANGLEGEPIVARVKGRELVGLTYERLYTYDLPDIRTDGADVSGWRIVADPYVTLDDGTGIVHIAPAFGEDDYRIGLREKLPMPNAIDREGRAVAQVEVAAGKWFKKIDPDVITDLKRRRLLFKSQKHEHNYPHCYRTDAPLISYPLESWFIKVTAAKERLIELNQTINWQPGHIKDGRFGDWLNNLVDWSLSRDRFWGTPLPVWTCPECGHEECVGSFEQLRQRCPEQFEGVTDIYDQSQFNPHRPYIDDFKFSCPVCDATMVRERYVIDPWFDAGSMPFSQLHYPFENAELVDGDPAHGQFPADFISEAVDQTRGWFYTLHAIAALIKDSVSYKSCLVVGHILDEKGRKMSKRLGNVVDPWKVIDAHGADAFRWYFYSSGNLFLGARFSDAGVVEGLQRFLIPLWNVYSFFSIYANIDGFDPQASRLPWERLCELDKWILLKLNRLVGEVTEHLERLEICEAAQKFEAFVEAASNWYVRRSRRRFWQPVRDDVKWAAYQTLYHVLVTLSKLLAPFTPFLSEELHQKLVRRFDAGAPLSVHLCAYPVADPALSDEQLEFAMDSARRVWSLGHAARKESQLRVRQPLKRITLISRETGLREAVASHMDVILDELNVKAVEWAEDEEDFVSYHFKPEYGQLGLLFGQDVKTVAQWIESHPKEMTAQLQTNEKSGRRITKSLKTLIINNKSRQVPYYEFHQGTKYDTLEGFFDAIRRAIQREGSLPPDRNEEQLSLQYPQFLLNKFEESTSTTALDVEFLNYVSVPLYQGYVPVPEDCFEGTNPIEKPETIAQRDGKLLLVLDAHVDETLKLEGLAREIVSRLQNRRKVLDLDYVQRIAVEYTAPDNLVEAIEAHLEYIKGETLALALQRVLNLNNDGMETAEIDSMEFCYSIELV